MYVRAGSANIEGLRSNNKPLTDTALQKKCIFLKRFFLIYPTKLNRALQIYTAGLRYR